MARNDGSLTLRNMVRIALTGNPIGKAMLYVYEQYIVRPIHVRRLQKRGLAIIAEVTDLLKAHGIEVFVDFGTMLGFVRDKRPVKNDRDIDFSLLPDQDLFKVLSVVVNHGFQFVTAYEYDGVITEITTIYKGIHIDFAQYHKDEQGRFYIQAFLPDLKNDPSKTLARRAFRPEITTIRPYFVKGFVVNVPENYDECLTADYGNWRVPNYKWHYIKDHNESLNVDLPGYATTCGLEDALKILSKMNNSGMLS